MSSIFLLLLFFSFTFFGFIPPAFSSASSTAGLSTRPSKVRLSALGSTENRGIFYIDYLLPLYYSEDQSTLLFFNPKQTLYTPSAEETSLGVGLRKIFNDSFILGTHFFFDRRLSHSNKLYSQVGAGLEFLSQPFDFRFNYYDPTTKAKVVDETHEFGSTTLINIQSMEEPLGGYDFEFGFPLPPKKLKTRLYFGGFFFDSKLGKDNNGYRIRSETNLSNWLALDLTFNSRNAQETEFIGGLRVTIPLELDRLFSKQNPSKSTLKDSPILQDSSVGERESSMDEAMKEAERSEYLKDRLFERVVRDIDVQSTTATKREAQKDSNGQEISMIFVDNSNNSGSENGSLEHPYNSLAEAFASSRYGAGVYIYVSKGDGTSTGYSGNFTLANNVVFWGSGYNGGYTGLSATGYPIINGLGVGPVVTLANNNTVMGLQVQNGGTHGIYGNGISGTATVRNNYVTSNGGAGIRIETRNTDTLTATVLDNTASSNTTIGLLLYSHNTSVLTATVSGNIFNSNTNGGYLTSVDSSIINATVSGNTFNSNTSSGLCVAIYGSSTFTATVSGNTANGNHLGGGGNSTAGIVANFFNSAGGNVTISNNTANLNDGMGCFVYSGSSSPVSVTILSNTFSNSANGEGAGLDLSPRGTGTLTATVSENTLSGNLHGIYVDGRADNAKFSGTITSNTFTDNITSGVYLGLTNSDYSVNLSRNTITGSAKGINITNNGSAATVIDAGGGALGSIGYNSIFGNTTYDMTNPSALFTASAQSNWWGRSTPLDSQFNGLVDHSNPLSSNPN